MITFRKATKKDIPVLIEMRIRFLSEHQGRLTPTKHTELKDNLLEYFARRLESDEFIAWLALDGERVVATSGLCFYSLPPTAMNLKGQTAYIMNMYTLPEYRKRGIAKQLFEKLLQEARILGYHKIVLHASKDGMHLYRTYGFKEPSDIELEFYDKE
jgi:ribosomal protein S18 acetylase RimI-like enzyme